MPSESAGSLSRAGKVNACRLGVTLSRYLDADDLIDAQGVAELLGLAQRNTVSAYQRRYPAMPRPVVDLGKGRCKLWLGRDIKRWLTDRLERAGR